MLRAAALDRQRLGQAARRTAKRSGCSALFAASIGLPFFALAANGPLLQAWFARTDHPAAKDPYFLYAASNVGSFLALLSYPLRDRAVRAARRPDLAVDDRLLSS